MASRNLMAKLFSCFFNASLFLSLVSADLADDRPCPGPIRYYSEIGCTAVYSDPDDPCPTRYNCDHLKNLPLDKCFINGHEYAIGEQLRDEDKNPCDIGCTCRQSPRGPEFSCAIVDCFAQPQPNCYLKREATSCCPGQQVCPGKKSIIPTCMVDGKQYKDGEYFKPASEPEKDCYCGEGYTTGKNVEPFCVSPKNLCGTLLRHSSDIRQNCNPTYYHSQSPNTSCSVAYRCQNPRDVIVPRNSSTQESKSADGEEPDDPDMMCTFGNLKMRIGDQLNQATDYSSVCMRCVCEVPPIATCQRLSDKDCDVTEHPSFS